MLCQVESKPDTLVDRFRDLTGRMASVDNQLVGIETSVDSNTAVIVLTSLSWESSDVLIPSRYEHPAPG